MFADIFQYDIEYSIREIPRLGIRPKEVKESSRSLVIAMAMTVFLSLPSSSLFSSALVLLFPERCTSIYLQYIVCADSIGFGFI